MKFQHASVLRFAFTRIVCCLFVTILATTIAVRGQTYTVLHNFSGVVDGATPYAGLTIDRAGNLYGTTSAGGLGSGTVFRLAERNGAWLFSSLYEFSGGNDGREPMTRVVFAPDGTLYGTTYLGGEESRGVVFRLQPSATFCPAVSCPWHETVSYAFGQGGGDDGAYPDGEVIFDRAGNLYGATQQGSGQDFYGTVYELSPSQGGYTNTILYGFDENQPFPGGVLALDAGGNVDGITEGILGEGCSVFQLTNSGSGWMETIIFNQYTEVTGGYPSGGLIIDNLGNLYGTNALGGAGSGGTAYELSPSNGGWSFNVLHAFTGLGQGTGGPVVALYMDSAGDLYGTTYADGASHHGSVFKLTYQNGNYVYTSLHDFTGGSDGSEPYSNVVIDASGNLYGTTSAGGASGNGVVWEITP